MHASFVSSNLLLGTKALGSMAGAETDVMTRKLSVTETLKQATSALETHRAWMKRRVSTSVAPLNGRERNDGESVVVGDVDDGVLKSVNVAWAIGSDKELKRRGENHRSTAGSAPPPSNRAWQAQVGASSSGELSALAEETDHLQHGSQSGSTSPSPTAQDNLDLLESPTTPFLHKGLLSPDMEQEDSQPSASDSLHFTFSSSSLPSSMIEQSNSKVKKKKRIGKATVVPAVKPKSSETPRHGGSVTDSSRPLSPDVFVGESFHSNLSPPPPASMLVAWGSLTSLDNYIESLEASSSMEEKPVRPKSVKFNDPSPLEKTAKAERTHSPEEFTNLKFKSPSISEQIGSRDRVDESPYIHSPDTSLSKDQESGESSFENSHSTEHFEALKASSSATVIPVTPAPKGKRSSYSLHKQSKLMAAEADRKVYDVQHKKLSNLQNENELTSVALLDMKSPRQSSTSDIPDSVLQQVLSNQRDRLRKSRYSNSSEHVAAAKLVQPQTHHVDEKEDKTDQLSPTHSHPRSLQMETSSQVSHVDSHTPLPMEKEKEKKASSTKSILVRSQSFPAKRSGGDSLEKDNRSPKEEGGDADASEVLARSRSSPKLRRSTLDTLNLPPLKKIIGTSWYTYICMHIQAFVTILFRRPLPFKITSIL